MYTVGARTQTVDAFTQSPALVHTVADQADDQYVPAMQPAPTAAYVQPASYTSTRPAAVRTVSSRRSSAPAPARNVSRRSVSDRRIVSDDRVSDDRVSDDRVVSREEARQPERTWKKTALIIGGSAASGAGVGAIVDGKKGAAIGAAIGGGAASIYEATRRR
jgi:hypothetical protein